jgi:hypothetical protein
VEIGGRWYTCMSCGKILGLGNKAGDVFCVEKK